MLAYVCRILSGCSHGNIHTCTPQGKILVGTQDNEILEVEEKTGQVQVMASPELSSVQ